MLITFLLLEQAVGDTIIVQVELEKLLEISNCVYRNAKDICKIFRTNDTVEKQSSPVLLRLDLSTLPAQERRHEPPEMMVKKIKSVLGKDIFSSSSRGVIAFTSGESKRLHLYELESSDGGPEVMDDEVEGDEKVDESLIDTEMMG